eukprot:TRINITY_DN2575_c0_g1_i2.p1 TRINITY_DN2575_c0_g1~~TRINITY_DN2575_c0_g1_i2.p1  ORF type:complete len:252 (+),score=56.12 TRINITY_DN2575_c0_g1_i2:140-895(+)
MCIRDRLCTWVNNEIGVVQDIKKLVKIMKEEHKKKNTDNLLRIIVDGAQAVGKIECDIKDCGIDYFTFTAHKIFGPKGIGAVSIKKTGKERMRIKPMIFGGGQQKGTRSGTLAPFLIVGFGKALEIAKKELENDTKHVNNLFNILYDELKALFPNIQLNGDLQQRYHGNLNVTIPHFTQKQFQQLSKNIEVSQGAACLLTQEPSYVLKEIYRENHEKLKGLHLRIGLGRFTTLKEIEILVDELTKLKQDFL